jgi:hypothetical protein
MSKKSLIPHLRTSSVQRYFRVADVFMKISEPKREVTDPDEENCNCINPANPEAGLPIWIILGAGRQHLSEKLDPDPHKSQNSKWSHEGLGTVTNEAQRLNKWSTWRACRPVLRIRIRCLFDPWIRNRFFPDPRSQTHIFESLVSIFWVKSFSIL